ncbi:ketoacyl-ACP synthase III [Anaerovibrio sp.]|uniref:ketoacyl-ACP synthase III n=1 Tax=Anaerovibrio sp. TaxID=1872532 RepID=UPI0025BBDA25|nr:ketoacyl-ACP synthase III [Anaerovibrio sp.]
MLWLMAAAWRGRIDIMKVKLSNLKISHIASGLPHQIINISEYEKYFNEKEVKRIKKSTGVESVHVADESMCTSDYGVILAKRLMKESSLTGDDFDGIVFISQTPDYRVPATSVIMQDRLGLPQSAVAFDINYGCSGYVYGLYQAALLVSSGSCQRVLVFTGDTQLRMIHEQDRGNRMVLGDGFAVTVVERGAQTMCFNIHSDGSGYQYIFMEAGGWRLPKSAETAQPVMDKNGHPRWPEYTYMDGLEIMNFALSQVPPMVKDTLEYAGWQLDEVGTFAMHQANQLILEFLAKRIGVSLDRMPIELKHMGNTVSASVPLMLSKTHKELVARNGLSKVLICGFGVGLSWGALTTDLSDTVIYDIWEI